MEAGGLLIPRPQAEFQKPMKKGMANELEEAKMRKCFKKDQLLTVLNDIKKQKRSRKNVHRIGKDQHHSVILTRAFLGK